MDTAAHILMGIVSFMLIVTVLCQNGQSGGLSGIVGSGVEHTGGKAKPRGIDLLLHRMTVVLGTVFFILALLVSYLIKFLI